MKKLIIKSLLMVGIMVGVSNYALYVMTGKSPFNSPPSISLEMPNKQDIQRGLSGGKETVYKWTDAQGKTHYSSSPPKDQPLAKKLEINPDVNLIQGVQSNTEKHETAPAQNQSAPITRNVYHPESVKKLMDDAKNVQKLLNERNEANQKALENL